MNYPVVFDELALLFSVGKPSIVSCEITLHTQLFDCRILNGVAPHPAPQLGMVEDGTKCREGAICINLQCTPLRTIIMGACPRGTGNRTCSGKGVSKKCGELCEN